MKKREIFIVIAVILFGLIYNEVKTGGDIEISFFEGCNVSPRHLVDKRHPHDYNREEIRYSLDKVAAVEIENSAGSISVERTGENGGEIVIQPMVRVYHRTESRAEKISRDITIKSRTLVINESAETRDNSTAAEQPANASQLEKLRIVVLPEEDFPYRRVRVHFNVKIPEGIDLDLWNRYGNIDIDNCGKNINLDNKYGDVSVKNITPLTPGERSRKKLKIRHRYGDVDLSQIKRAVDLTSRYSRLKAYNISALELDCAYTRATIEEIEKDVNVENASHSSIKLKNAQKVTIDGRSTRIKLDGVTNGVNVENSHNYIYMDNIQGNILVKARNCKIKLADVVSDSIVLRNSYDYVGLKRIIAKNIDLVLDHGRLDLAFDRVDQRINIKNTHSRIRIWYPETVTPAFNLSLRHGKVINRTQVEMDVLTEREQTTFSSGEFDGTPEIIVTNTYGNVEFNRFTPLPVEKPEKTVLPEKPETPLPKAEKEKQ